MGSSREAHRELSEGEIVGSSSQLRIYQNMLARKLLGAIYFAEEACYLSKGISLALIVVGRPLIS